MKPMDFPGRKDKRREDAIKVLRTNYLFRLGRTLTNTEKERAREIEDAIANTEAKIGRYTGGAQAKKARAAIRSGRSVGPHDEVKT